MILDLCGGSGAWSKPYSNAGYEVLVVDTLNGLDVRGFVPPSEVHGVLASPPCTEFAASGAAWWRNKPTHLLEDAVEVVFECLRIITESNPVWWALENPVGRLIRFIGPWDYTFNPCDYGDPYTKRTLIWGDHIKPIKTPVPPTEGSKMLRLGPSKDRVALRSVTPSGFAQAFFEANP